MLEVWLGVLGLLIIAQTWLFSVLVKGLSSQIENGSEELRGELAAIIDKVLEQGVPMGDQGGLSPIASWLLQNIADQHQNEPREIEPRP